jgi:hypothetical protein
MEIAVADPHFTEKLSAQNAQIQLNPILNNYECGYVTNDRRIRAYSESINNIEAAKDIAHPKS